MSDQAGPSRSTSSHPTPQSRSIDPISSSQKSKGKAPARAKPIPRAVEAFENPDQGEETTVHEVYELIAPHFSQTRHKPWPLITTFLNNLPPGSIGLDSGAGNGKYLPTAAQAGHTMVALDRSSGLLDIARRQEGAGDVVRGDLGATCWRKGVFDFVISVAAIHHLSTPERRRQAVQALLPCLRLSEAPPYARFFIYVWAYEQGPMSKRAMGSLSSSSKNPHTVEGAPEVPEKVVQDVLVPWVLKSQSNSRSKSIATTTTNKAKSQTTDDLKLDKERVEGEETERGEEEEEDKVYHRYYHLFVKDELRDLVCAAAETEGYRVLPLSLSSETNNVESEKAQTEDRWMRIRGEGWEADNWWIEAEVGRGAT